MYAANRLQHSIAGQSSGHETSQRITGLRRRGRLTHEFFCKRIPLCDIFLDIIGQQLLKKSMKFPTMIAMAQMAELVQKYIVLQDLRQTDDIQIEVPDANHIVIKGIDKQKVGQFAAEVRGKRPPEPYKGKGIKYDYEVVRRKEGKTGAK